jgi:ribose 5-phosphate isomerase B
MIALGADHGGFELKEAIKKHLDEKGVEYIDCGAYSPESIDYAPIAQKTCEKVTSGECEKAILCCGTGIGISMAANKVRGIRACCCSDLFSAEMTRLHNNANILCLGGRVVTEEKAKELVDIFLDTPFSCEERHQRRIDQITDLENRF